MVVLGFVVFELVTVSAHARMQFMEALDWSKVCFVFLDVIHGVILIM